MKKLIFFAVIFTLTFSPMLASAQTNPCTVEAVRGNSDSASSLGMCVSQVYKWALGVSLLLALLMMVLGGYFYMTAAGNAEQAAKGKEFIIGALIGVTILFTAYLLLNQINPDLVNFDLRTFKSLDNR